MKYLFSILFWNGFAFSTGCALIAMLFFARIKVSPGLKIC